MVERIKCGDTEHCEHCANNGEVDSETGAFLQRNALGRCDYYDGPDSRRRAAQTHGHDGTPPRR